METKLPASRLEDIRYKTNFKFGFVVDVISSKGGLILMWKEEVQLAILSYSAAHINACICDPIGMMWNVTFFYGNPIASKRKQSWDILRALLPVHRYPWLVFGDFNEILCRNEKVEGNENPLSQITAFRDALHDCGLHDLGFKGPQFTWSNRRQDSDKFIKERLDRVVANAQWFHSWPSYSVLHLNVSTSDHCCIWVCLNKGFYKKCYKLNRFRYESRWGKSDNCKNIVRHCWTCSPISIRMRKLNQKLDTCATHLKRWTVKENYRKKASMAHLCKKLDSLVKFEMAGDQSEINIVRHQMRLAREEEEEILCNQSKQLWLQGRDQNSRFFHDSMKYQTHLKHIDSIVDEDGTIRESIPDIQAGFVSYFGDIFTSGLGGQDSSLVSIIQPLVSQTENHNLLKPVSKDKVWRVVFDLNSNKAPGSDGFSAGFYHQNWETVGQDVYEAIKHFFESGILAPEINSTFIVLIPKKSDAQKVTDYRPISL